MRFAIGFGLAGTVLVAACATGRVEIELPPEGDAGADVPSATCTQCGADCVDTKIDANNCGACGKACSTGAKCVKGACQCDQAATTCAGQCVDTKTDAKNCGGCGVVCGGDGGTVMGGGTYGCVNGTCSVICPMGKTECGGACVDTKTDALHCGMCQKACMMGESCVDSLCCKTGQVVCAGKCTSTLTDPMNCGMCGKVCSGATPGCGNGTCQAFVDHGPMHTFVNLTTDHYITQGACSLGQGQAADADYFCKRFYGMNCTVQPGYVAHTTPTPTYPKMHKRGGCTSQGSDIPNTTCDTGPCKIGNWSETTQGLANLICRCL